VTGPDDPFGRDPFERERDERVGQASRAARPYLIVVGVLFVAIAGFATISSLSTERAGVRGLNPGVRMPKFAAPSATGELEGDANVFQNARQAGDGRPACKVPAKDAIRICDYFDRPLVLVAWFSRCKPCKPQLDTVERIRRRVPGVAFVGVDVRDSQDKARSIVTENGWRFPIGVDRDGAVGALYGVGVGPTTFFAYTGGVLAETAIGELDQRELEKRVRRLVRVSRRRARVRAVRAG
jgi:cytochrome c-type biogenesis protein